MIGEQHGHAGVPCIGRRLVATGATAVTAFIALNIGFAATLALSFMLLAFNAVTRLPHGVALCSLIA